MARFTTSQYLLIALNFLLVVVALLHINWIWESRRQRNSKYISRGKVAEPFISSKQSTGRMGQPPTPLMLTQLSSNNWKLDTIRDLFFTEVNRAHVQCCKMRRLGPAGDGGYEICLDKGYTFEPGCLTYSFGVGKMWEFDEQMAQHYKCTVRAFDPTLGLPEHIHKPGPVRFYPIGIGDGSKVAFHNYKTQTFRSFLKRFGEENQVINLLKIDVEYSEWHSLLNIMTEGLLKRVKQLILELHTKETRVITKR